MGWVNGELQGGTRVAEHISYRRGSLPHILQCMKTLEYSDSLRRRLVPWSASDHALKHHNSATKRRRQLSHALNIPDRNIRWLSFTRGSGWTWVGR